MMFAPMILLAAVATSGANAGSATFSVSSLQSLMETLCKPEWVGRLTGTEGEKAAAKFIAGEFRKAGLRPGGDDGTFFHEFDVRVNQRPSGQNMLVIEREGQQPVWPTLGTEYVPLVGSTQGRLRSGNVVFVGFGTQEEIDAVSSDLQGSIAVVIRGDRTEQERPTSNTIKARALATAGVDAIVFVGPLLPGSPEVPPTARNAGIPPNLNIAAFGLHRKHANALSGMTFEQLREAKPQRLPTRIRHLAGLEANDTKGTNVIGILPGNDPKLRNEYIIIGAHYDHLGWGEVGSRTGVERPHVGADDNASGTVGVIELARYFAETRSNRRTIIFQAYSGEEVGLVGARAWVRDNQDFIKNTTAMINLDMIGRLRPEPGLVIYGAESAKEFGPILAGVNFTGNFAPTGAISGNSDHAPFAGSGVPILFFNTGLHNEYHTERDTPETINYEGMAEVLSVIVETVKGIDRINGLLQWNPESPFQRRVPARPN
ncbi:MAG: M28 family peptidase [Fimbriimonadaceae bacterium]